MSGKMITTSTNERHRLEKLMRGNDGTTFEAAHDEKVDDSIDAGAKLVHSTFVDGNLEKIYNNSKPPIQQNVLSYNHPIS